MDDHVDDADSAIFSAVLRRSRPARSPRSNCWPTPNVIDTHHAGDRTCTERGDSAAPPQVRTDRRAAGRIQWTASDPDAGDMLLFTVQYSHDSGAAWHTLVSRLSQQT
jgi:hypothetical protein